MTALFSLLEKVNVPWPVVLVPPLSVKEPPAPVPIVLLPLISKVPWPELPLPTMTAVAPRDPGLANCSVPAVTVVTPL